jgi:penicillin-binding protein 1A
MSFTRTLLSAAVIGIAFGAVAVSSVTVELVHRETLSLPSLAPLSGAIAASTSRILASDGSSMGAFASQDRDPVSISNIPKLVQNAFVASEDRNFWKNDGIDPLAIARAFVTDVRMRGTDRRAIGASTITQQVVKNFIVGDQKTLIRKVREALLAVRLDKEIGKPRILEIYLNEIYLGEAAYGVSAAAEAYFGKPLVSLDLAEAALIGGMPKGPKNYDPLRHPDAARGRRSYVLNRMFEDGYITATQEAEADREPLPTPSPHLMSGTADDFFAEEVRRETVAALGSAVFYSGGLTVQTSEVPALQKLAEKSLRDGLIAYDRRHGWRGPVGVVPAGTDLSTPSSWREALMEVDAPAGADDWSLGVVLGYTAAGDGVVGFADGSTAALTLHSLQWARPVVGSGLGNIPTSVTQVVHPGDVVLTSIDSQGELHLQQIPAVEGSLIAMNVHTGQVVAIAGGFSFAGGSFDRAVQSERQPGSAFKPFVYLTAFEHGYVRALQEPSELRGRAGRPGSL